MQHETRGRDTKGDIHRAAVELFAAQGYVKTSVREIAETVGITKASLYHHYSSKQDLLHAIIQPALDDMRAAFARVGEQRWSPERQQEVLGACLDVVLSHRAVGLCILRDIAAVPAALGDQLDDVIDLSRRIQAWLAGPDPTRAVQLLAFVALEVIRAAPSAGLVAAELSDEELRAIMLDAATAILSRRDRCP